MLVLTTILPNVGGWVVVFSIVITLFLSIGGTEEAWLLVLASSAGDEILFFKLSWFGMNGSTGTS